MKCIYCDNKVAGHNDVCDICQNRPIWEVPGAVGQLFFTLLGIGFFIFVLIVSSPR